MAQIAHRYSYAAPSDLVQTAAGARLRLAADSPAQTCFFDGRLTDPATSAMCLRTVSDLVGTRFYTPPSMLARILREADPVATVSTQNLRFEGFSACCSTYIRHDIDAQGFSATAASAGTVNVDFRDEMRAALAQVRTGDPLQLTISAEAVTLAHKAGDVVEKKVPLPLRWIKGFAEAQTHQAGMHHALRLEKVAAQRFLRSLPRAASNQPQWIAASGGTPRLSARETPGGIRIAGTQRLRLLERAARTATHLDIYFNAAQGSSAWVLSYGAQRLTLVLNAEPWRGFSGDGQLLSDLTRDAGAIAAALRAQLHWQAALEVETLAATCGLTLADTRLGLAQLAAAGLLGFDVTSGAYFHRVLPFELDQIAKRNPRLDSARALVAAGAVTLTPDGGAEVRSGDVIHRVRTHDGQPTCTCPWFAKNQAARGPCKHILAAQLLAEAHHD